MTPGRSGPALSTVRGADIAAKIGLVILMALAITHPDLGNMRDKAAGLRAVGYPALAFTLPAVWWALGRDRMAFPWLADLMISLTCFTDTLGNRLDLYDTVVWFDDWMHLMNTGLLTAAVLLLTVNRTATQTATLERALAFGVTAALGWELAEYFAFLHGSSERQGAYTDTLADLSLGTLGAVIAAVVVHAQWKRGGLTVTEPAFGSDVSLPAGVAPTAPRGSDDPS